MVSFSEFKKLEIKIARILEAKDHPNADKLYVLSIGLGNQVRQIVAGIKSSYNSQDLIGKQIAVVTNLETATIRGVESQGHRDIESEVEIMKKKMTEVVVTRDKGKGIIYYLDGKDDYWFSAQVDSNTVTLWKISSKDKLGVLSKGKSLVTFRKEGRRK